MVDKAHFTIYTIKVGFQKYYFNLKSVVYKAHFTSHTIKVGFQKYYILPEKC